MPKLSRVLTGLACSAFLGAAPVMAQGAEFSLGGGVSLPLGDFDDASNTGWHGLAAVGFKPADFPVGFQIDGMYQRFGVDDATGFDDVSTQMIQGTANIVYAFQTAEGSQFRPYLIGGVGLYNSKLTGDGVPAGFDESETDFGLNAGAGFDFDLGNVAAFIEGRFHNIFSDPENTNFIPISVGIRFGG